MKNLRLFLLGLIALAGGNLQAAELIGTVTDPDGKPIPSATVRILGTDLNQVTNKDGSFNFPNLKDDSLEIQVDAAGFYSSLAVPVALNTTKEAETKVTLQPMARQNVTMLVVGNDRSVSELSQTVDVLNGEELDQARHISLGETLSGRPGISSTAFGPVAGRPIIRGLSGERIRILEGGMGTGDVSTTSVDHTITVDMGSVEEVEILRGAATLRFGGSAVGGVINLLDNRIPTRTDKEFSGSVDFGFDSVSELQHGRAAIQGSQGAFSWQVNATSTETEDYEIPGEPERFEDDHDDDHHDGERRKSGDDEDEIFDGTMENTAMDLEKMGVGVAYSTARGTIGVSVIDYRNQYGLPGHDHHHHDHEDEHDHDKREGDDDHDDHDEHGEEEGAAIDLEQQRFDFLAEAPVNAGFLELISLRIGGTDYEHEEGEGDSVGVVFDNEYLEGRLEATTGETGFFTNGTMGIHVSDRDFSAIGAESFIQPSKTENLAFYVSQEKDFTNGNFNVGVRFDRQKSSGSVIEDDHDHDDHDHDKRNEEDGHDDDHEEPEEIFYDRDFDNVSAVVGVVFGTDANYSIAANLTYTERAPNAEALFAFGPHLATSSYEIGNPNLESETSQGLDILMRKKSGIVTGEISLFMLDFDNYIYEAFTGEEVDELREMAFTQDNSKQWGGEARIQAALYDQNNSKLNLVFSHDLVYGELDDGTDLPRITPQRTRLGMTWTSTGLRINGNVQHTYEQDRVAAFETTTESFTLVNLGVGYQFKLWDTEPFVQLLANNITDEEARIHTSFIKDRILQPGRNLALSVRLDF